MLFKQCLDICIFFLFTKVSHLICPVTAVELHIKIVFAFKSGN